MDSGFNQQFQPAVSESLQKKPMFSSWRLVAGTYDIDDENSNSLIIVELKKLQNCSKFKINSRYVIVYLQYPLLNKYVASHILIDITIKI